MKKVAIKLKKSISCRVIGSAGTFKLKLPNQVIGTVALMLDSGTITKQWELVLAGDQLKAVVVK